MQNMETIEHTDTRGRTYRARKEDDLMILIGPPEGLVDELGLPEPFATRLHNALYERGLLSYEDVKRAPQNLLGALQEALAVDQQKLSEAFFSYTQEVAHA